MATIEENVDNLKLKASSEKRKEEVLLKKKQGQNDGKVHQSGEDSTDSGPSNPPLLPDLFKEIGRLVPTQEDQTQKEETRDVEMKESEDSTDAVPSTRPTVMESTYAVPSTRPTAMESTDAVPSTRPTVMESTDAVPSTRPTVMESTDAVPSTRPTVMESTDAVPSTRPTAMESTDAVPSTRPTAMESTDAVPFTRPTVMESTDAVPFTRPTAMESTDAVPSTRPTVMESTDAVPSTRPTVMESTDAVPFTRPTAMESTDAVPSTSPTVMESTDAVPSTRPTAIVSAVQQSSPPLVEQPHKQEASTRTCPSSFAGPGPRFEDGERQAINVEEDKDLILLETAEKVAGVCGLRQVALRLRITESMVAQIEHDNPKLIPQFYQVFQLVSKRLPNSEEMFKQLLETMDKTNQGSTAIWLRKRLGMREPEASIGGEESSPISDVIPQTEETGRNSDNEFYDIFLMYTGRSDVTKKFQNICRRRKWKVNTFDTISAASPPHMAIGSILNTSTHLALIITESDCIKYKNHEMCMTVEMALQLAYTQGTLAGKVLPIRCCQKRSLPLVLQALTGAHIDEDSFEERLVATIDTRTRLSRMREKQN